MATATPERMSRVDTAWLRMDNPSNLMMILGVWLLEPGVSHAALCQRVEERLLKYKRFRQKVVEDAMGASWVTDRSFDLQRHVRSERLAPRKGQSPRQALEARAAELATTPLDPAHPLWQLHLIEDYPDVEGRRGSAMIARIHHCIADGIALISVMLSITDGGKPPPERAQKPDDEKDWLSDAVLKPITDVAIKAIGLYGDGVAKSVELLSKPQQPLFGSVEMALTGAQIVKDVAALALMPDDSPTRLKGKPGTSKRVAWCEPIPLDDVRSVGKALGASINDVLLACAAGAIGGYLEAKGDDPTGQEIRAMVPVNLRPLEKAHQLGNRFGLVPLVLPIGIANPVQRVYAVRRRMNELKGSYQPVLAFGVLAIAGLLVKPVQHALLNLFAKKATAVMTNVPGPKEPLKFCGATLRQTMFWVPQSGDIGMGVSILSYGGGVQFGLITDSTLCPDPEAIIERFAPEFEKLLLVTLMLPWGE
ncbi:MULTISPECIES: wax ester/triacylglycerol synthase family O-acyltransferase [unclassified Methylibium]|uniref:wax ester/triacylglycerol synthase family O-acyltransferase n=1 Tax=unclassified Methylibium TaxID=2633235 RepID=UPI0003F44D30|nr:MULTISPECIES: wax ester/triacylglycerol synthase family O-acyltransferase [unclassified Methylibium]EWS57070.1 putative diacylglycerol O-acyltransferase tgs1 [Methylibium sp. T29]EWS60557.1 putative diacylglycerol O-acyltransferase tgs1 [Methylibium sp. T29-B]